MAPRMMAATGLNAWLQLRPVVKNRWMNTFARSRSYPVCIVSTSLLYIASLALSEDGSIEGVVFRAIVVLWVLFLFTCSLTRIDKRLAWLSLTSTSSRSPFMLLTTIVHVASTIASVSHLSVLAIVDWSLTQGTVTQPLQPHLHMRTWATCCNH